MIKRRYRAVMYLMLHDPPSTDRLEMKLPWRWRSRTADLDLQRSLDLDRERNVPGWDGYVERRS